MSSAPVSDREKCLAGEFSLEPFDDLASMAHCPLPACRFSKEPIMAVQCPRIDS
jgi:hypothetical protein